MKKIFLLLAFMSVMYVTHAQIVGKYEAIATENINAQTDVVITQDAKASKKVWISGICKEGVIYALLQLKDEESMIYNIPVQTVGTRTITAGSVVYDLEENEIAITNDPLSNPSDVSIGRDGINVIGQDGNSTVKISSQGSVKTNDGNGQSTDIGKNGVKVTNKPQKATYFSYVGQKLGVNPKRDNDD